MHDIDGIEISIHWAGFVGAWLLVAGPLFQGANELTDEQFDQREFQATPDLEPSEPISRWWWLIPPVAYIKARRRAQTQRDAWMAALTSTQRERMIGFSNKASGWFFVASGAFLIFLKEAWELHQIYELQFWVYVVVVVVLALAAIGNTISRLHRADVALHADEPGYEARIRGERAELRAQRKAGGSRVP